MTYAVVFKVYRWDDAADHNFRRCRALAVGADFFILYDRTYGDDLPENIRTHDRVFFVTNQDALDLGLSGTHDGGVNLFWYNADYQHSLFVLKYPDYDFFCFVESDVAVNTPLAPIMRKMKEQGLELIFQPQLYAPEQWSHFITCAGYYDDDTYINKGLFCISFFSRRALLHILQRRLNMTALQQRRKLSTWPISEAVMAHEPIRAGMKWARLDTVCRGLDHYDWSPPYAVAELDGMIGMDIVHPVTSMNRSFMIRNFQQDYHSLWSEKEVREGRSRTRARTIRDFEVFARLYNSPHIQSARDRAQAILEDARLLLESETLFLLHGTNRLAEEKWRVRGSREQGFPTGCLSDLPNWDEHQVHDMQSGEWVEVTLSPVRTGSRLLVGAQDARFIHVLRVENGNGDGKCFPLLFQRVFRDMIFGVFDIPAECDSLCLTAQMPGKMFSLRLGDGKWTESVAVEKAEMPLLSGSAA